MRSAAIGDRRRRRARPRRGSAGRSSRRGTATPEALEDGRRDVGRGTKPSVRVVSEVRLPSKPAPGDPDREAPRARAAAGARSRSAGRRPRGRETSAGARRSSRGRPRRGAAPLDAPEGGRCGPVRSAASRAGYAQQRSAPGPRCPRPRASRREQPGTISAGADSARRTTSSQPGPRRRASGRRRGRVVERGEDAVAGADVEVGLDRRDLGRARRSSHPAASPRPRRGPRDRCEPAAGR